MISNKRTSPTRSKKCTKPWDGVFTILTRFQTSQLHLGRPETVGTILQKAKSGQAFTSFHRWDDGPGCRLPGCTPGCRPVPPLYPRGGRWNGCARAGVFFKQTGCAGLVEFRFGDGLRGGRDQEGEWTWTTSITPASHIPMDGMPQSSSGTVSRTTRASFLRTLKGRCTQAKRSTSCRLVNRSASMGDRLGERWQRYRATLSCSGHATQQPIGQSLRNSEVAPLSISLRLRCKSAWN